jgi:nuclear pore complex protein Nup188
MNGVTTLYTLPGSVPDRVNYCDRIEIHQPISIPGMEGITLPHGTHGYVLKILEDDVALVHWEVFLSCAAILQYLLDALFIVTTCLGSILVWCRPVYHLSCGAS